MIKSLQLTTWKDWLGFGIIAISLIYFTCLAGQANVDLSYDRHVLFMDELIVHDGVDKMRTAQDASAFVEEAFGGDVRYGRILYYVSYLTSYIPSHIWGDQGAIVSVRMTQYFLLVVSYLLLCAFFIRSWLLRGLLFLALMTVPTTVYYATMPKPEPIQLLFYVLFLILGKQKKYGWGAHFLFLGLALGAKVSGLFIVLACFAVALFQGRTLALLKQFKLTAISTGLFLVGFLVGQGSILSCLWKRDWHPLIHFVTKIKMEAGEVKGDLLHNAWQWIDHIVSSYVTSPSWAFGLLVIIIGVALCVAFKNSFKSNADGEVFRRYFLMFGIFACISFVQIIFIVPRIWSFYLHPSAVMILVLIFLSIEYLNATRDKVSGIFSKLVVGVFVVLFIFSIPGSTHAFIDQSRRTKQESHVIKEAEYVRIKDVVDSASIALRAQRWGVFYDPGLYMLKTTDRYIVQDFWGKFDQWRFLAHAIVYYKENDPQVDDEDYYKGLYEKHVCDSPTQLGKKECRYVPVDISVDGVSFYFRVDLIKQLIDRNLIDVKRKGDDATFYYRSML